MNQPADQAAAGMALHLCDELVTGSATPADIGAAITRQMRDEDWCLTLERGDDFLDASPCDDGVQISCQIGDERLRSDGAIDDALLEAVFVSFLQGDDRWRKLCA